MARFYLFLSLILVSACAQIETLTGGEKDETAPKILNQEPEQGTTNFTGHDVYLEFDEYVKLKDPRSTISSNPSNIRVQASLKDKTVHLHWDEELLPATTYVIQLSGTVVDNHESNDSILQIAFSSGSSIDSLTLSGNVKDAFSGKPLSQVTVGLYAKDSLVMGEIPLYGTRTDREGRFRFSYLKEGSYELFAFNDVNKNQAPDADEAIAFSESSVHAGDTVPHGLRMFRTRTTQTLAIAINLPGSAYVSGIDSLDLDRLTVNGLPPNLYERFSEDSLLIELPVAENGKYTFRYDSMEVVRPVSATERTKRFSIYQNGLPVWKSGDTLSFSINESAQRLDTNAIIVRTSQGDTIRFISSFEDNRLAIIPQYKSSQPITITFNQSAVQGRTSSSDSVTFRLQGYKPSDLTTLSLNLASFQDDWLVQLYKGERLWYAKQKKAVDSVVTFEKIVPGEYTVRVIGDRNHNGRWDSGNYPSGRQPELIYQFTLTQKLRPNWEVEETLQRP